VVEVNMFAVEDIMLEDEVIEATSVVPTSCPFSKMPGMELPSNFSRMREMSELLFSSRVKLLAWLSGFPGELVLGLAVAEFTFSQTA
jgi:hypothetical protein